MRNSSRIHQGWPRRPNPADRPPIEPVIRQHAEDAVVLHNVRMAQVRAPHVKLHHLGRLDERLAAHLDGLAVAGEFGSRLCDAALENPGASELFAATVRALEGGDAARLERLLALAEAVPETQGGLSSAFGWVSSGVLQGTVRGLLSSPTPFHRWVGLTACAMHRVDAGADLERALDDPHPGLRARALRTLGVLGRRESFDATRPALHDRSESCRFWGAWSAVMLGNRSFALDWLVEYCRRSGPFRERSLQLALRAVDLPRAHQLIQDLARDGGDTRTLIRAVGIVGDPHHVPWLIERMEDPGLARLAGESFSLITGLDLAYLDLEQPPPAEVEPDPGDDEAAMDPDDGLPWPDPAGIGTWWAANARRFQAGVRHFMGEPANPENCTRVLGEGYQRQRLAAGLYLCLLRPGKPLFNTAAPAPRQQQRLTGSD